MVSSKDIQTDNGFVQIHPAILELLARQTLSGREFRCLMFLFRKTYGYHKKEDRISLSQWEQGTGIPRTRVGAVLAELAEKKIITKTDNGANRPATWSFNKYFETWQTDETVTPKGDSLNCDNEQNVTPTGDKTVTLEGTTLNETVTLEVDKTVTLQGDHNRKKEKKIHTSRSPKEPTPNGVMFERLCFILFSHTNTKDGLTDKQRGLLNAETKRMQKIGATPDKGQAQDLLSKAKNQGGKALSSAQPFTVAVNSGSQQLYRARFGGFDNQNGAAAACKALKRKGFACWASQQ